MFHQDKRLERLVPPQTLCAQIPAGKFADSALVYMAGGVVVPRYIKLGDTEHFNNGKPAPTLAEIMAAFPEYTTAYRNRYRWQVYIADCGDRGMVTAEDPDNPATAALRLWLEVEGIE